MLFRSHIQNPERLGKLVEKQHPNLKKDDPSYQVKLREAEYQELLRITKKLAPADQGSIVEQWYQKRYGKAGDQTQVSLDKDTYGLSEGRRPDRFEPNPDGENGEKTATLRDIKSTKEALTNPDIAQLEDSLKLAANGKQVSGHDVTEVSISLTNHEGGHASVGKLVDLMQKHEQFSVELFSAKGEPRTFRLGDTNPATNKPYTVTDLRKAMEQHTKGDTAD